jgi:hypothetical protein
MENVPVHALNMVRMAILRFAQERGHTVVTASIVDDATAQLCPANAREAMAEIVAAHDSGELGGNGHLAMEKMDWTDTALELLQSETEPSVRDTVQRRAEKKARRDHKVRVEDEHVRSFLSGQGSATGDCPFARRSQIDSAMEEHALTWDSAARQRLHRVPEGFVRSMTQRRVEIFAQRKGKTVVTLELLEEKYGEWAAGSAKQKAHLNWDDPAWRRIQKIPEFVRGMIIKEVEHCAQQLGVNSVTADVMAHACDSWSDKGVFHSEVAPKQYEENNGKTNE